MSNTNISLKALTCPNCGASVTVSNETEQFYCSYCGSKIIVSKDNEVVHRHIDEAKKIQAETERMVKMKELELEERRSSYIKHFTLIWAIISVAIIIATIVLLALEWKYASWFLLLVCIPCVAGGGYLTFKVIPEKANEKMLLQKGGVVFPKGLEPFNEKKVETMQSALQGAGFTNIQSVNLHDVKIGLLVKNGTVESISVNGESIQSGGKIYMPDATIIITYHGK